MRVYKKIILIMGIFIIALLSNKVYAAGVTISSNKSEVQIGDTFRLTVTGTGAATYDIKVSVSGAGISDEIKLNTYTEELTNENRSISRTYTAKQIGTVTISVKQGSNVTVAGGNSSQEVNTSSKTIKIIEKKINTETPTNPTTQATTSTSKPQPTKTTTKKTTTKKTDTKKTEAKKTEITPTEEKEEATPEWGIADVKLIGIKENGEKIDLELDKQFNINTYEYLCNVTSDIKKLEVNHEAYEYNEFVTITGIEEELKPGENIITLKLSKEGQQELIYTIKVNKQEQTQAVNAEIIDISEEHKEEKNELMINLPIWSFILMEIIIIAITALISVLITKEVMKNKKQKHTIHNSNITTKN